MLAAEEFFQCPYCGENISMVIEQHNEVQSYIEDCEVCCQPIALTVSAASDGMSLSARRCDE